MTRPTHNDRPYTHAPMVAIGCSYWKGASDPRILEVDGVRAGPARQTDTRLRGYAMGDGLMKLAAFVSRLGVDDVPVEVRAEAVRRVVDSVGSIVGGSREGQARAVRERWLQVNPTGPISILGTDRNAAVGPAVFLNALAAHTLEMDDVHTGSKTHIGSVVVPAAWGTTELVGTSGQDLVLAVVCGYEVMSRIGMAFGVSAHRARGWHATSTAGTFGAAAAAAKLLGLDAQTTAYALGLAGAQSFGTWAFLGDGASNKVLNPARAAQSGVEAALLAQAGMTGPVHILTAEDGGILSMMSDAPEAERVAEGLGEVWETCRVDSKPYPACRSTHCVIDGVLELRSRFGINAADVDAIEIETYQVGYRQCAEKESSIHPVNAVQAKFSTPFTAACALLHGKVTLTQLEADVIEDPELRSLMGKVRVRATEEFTNAYPAHWGCRVRITLDDGTVREVAVPDASGGIASPLSDKQIERKAIGLMEGAIDASRAHDIVRKALDIEQAEAIPQL